MSMKYGSIERPNVLPKDFTACLQRIQECRKLRHLAYQVRQLNKLPEKEFIAIVTDTTKIEAETQLSILKYAQKGIYASGDFGENRP